MKPSEWEKKVIAYLRPIFSMNLFGDKQTKEALIKAIYTHFPACKQNPTYPWIPSQIVGNCTFASFSVGMRKRLEESLFRLILTEEEGLFTSLSMDYRKQQPNLFKSDKEVSKDVSFSTIFKELLTQNYQEFLRLGNPYIMEAMFDHTENNLSLVIENILSRKDNNWTQEDRVMITGTPGMGKTLFVKTFSAKWHCRPDSNEIVIHLSFRELSNEQKYPHTKSWSLIDIVDQELLAPIQKRRCHAIERRLLAHELQHQRILWVIDGLDELHITKEREPMIKKLFLALAEQKKIIITSRPNIAYPSEIKISHELRLMGYPKNEMYRFINHYFATQDRDPTLPHNKIKKAITSNETLKSLCSAPIILNIVCALVKGGNEEVLTIKNSNLSNLYSQFIREILRNRSPTESDHQLQNKYHAAIKFSKLLAYTSVTKYGVSLSPEDIKNCLTKFKIKDSEISELFADVNAIGLLNISDVNAEFVHASFQEYFAASYLLQSLRKRPRSPRYQQAQTFIGQHKLNPKYENLFSWVIDQWIKVIHVATEEEKAFQLELLEEYLAHFTTYKTPPPFSDFANGIALLDSCVSQKFFPAEKYSPFIRKAFQQCLSNGLKPNEVSMGEMFVKNLQEEPFILSSFPPILMRFANLINTMPQTKKDLQIGPRLIENIETHLKDTNPESIISNTVLLLREVKKIHSQDLQKLLEIITSTKDQSLIVSFIERFLLPQLEMLLKENLSLKEIQGLVLIIKSMETHLSRKKELLKKFQMMLPHLKDKEMAASINTTIKRL